MHSSSILINLLLFLCAEQGFYRTDLSLRRFFSKCNYYLITNLQTFNATWNF